jgi:hypothetical protein
MKPGPAGGHGPDSVQAQFAPFIPTCAKVCESLQFSGKRCQRGAAGRSTDRIRSCEAVRVTGPHDLPLAKGGHAPSTAGRPACPPSGRPLRRTGHPAGTAPPWRLAAEAHLVIPLSYLSLLSPLGTSLPAWVSDDLPAETGDGISSQHLRSMVTFAPCSAIFTVDCRDAVLRTPLKSEHFKLCGWLLPLSFFIHVLQAVTATFGSEGIPPGQPTL